MLNSRGLWAFGIVSAMLIGFTVFMLSPESGEKEFGRAVEAVKQVRSYRYEATTAPRPSRHTEARGEMNCSQAALHQVVHVVDQNLNPSDFVEETVRMNTGTFQREADGTWRRRTLAEEWEKPEHLCRKLSSGADISFFPDMNHMQKKGFIKMGDKKIVNGVPCRVWKVDVVEYGTGLEGRTVCVGVDDHLPYEVTSDFDHSKTTFSDYNSAIEVMEPPSAVVSGDSSGAAKP